MPLLNPSRKFSLVSLRTYPLPPPRGKGEISVEEALARRRSVRRFLPKPLPLASLGQLLWAGQGVTDKRWGFRAAPSAGATYPAELFAILGGKGVEGLPAGLYYYDGEKHSLSLAKEGDLREGLSQRALGEPAVARAPVDLVIGAILERTTGKYGPRGERYVHFEVGHIAQNISLQGVALGLGSFVIGAFSDDEVRELLGPGEEFHPLYIIPVGYPEGRG